MNNKDAQRMNFNWFKTYLRLKNYRKDSLKKSYNILYKKYIELYKNNVDIIRIVPNSTLSSYIYNPLSAYGPYGMLIYHQYILNGQGPGASIDADVTAGAVESVRDTTVWGGLATSNPTNTPLNRSGLWFNSATNPGPFTFTMTLDVKCEKDIYLGVGADNRYRIAVNGVTFVDNTPFASQPYYTSTVFNYNINNALYHQFLHWNVYPLKLIKGINTIAVTVINPDGPAQPGYMGIELYDDSLQSIRDAVLDPNFVSSPTTFAFDKNYYVNLNMIFSTRYLRSNNNIISGTPFTIDVQPPYLCPMKGDDNLTLLATKIATQMDIAAPLKRQIENLLNLLFSKIEFCCSKIY